MKTALIVVVVVMMMMSSASAAFMLMGGEESGMMGPGPMGPGPMGPPPPPPPPTCSSQGVTGLEGKYWIVSTDDQSSGNRMIYLGASGSNGRAGIAEWDYWADPQTKWNINAVPNEAGKYWIVSDEGQRSTNRMIYLGDSDSDGRAGIGEWDYWADPLTKWKILKDPKVNGEYWIVSDENQRSTCKSMYVGVSGSDGRAQVAAMDYKADPKKKWKLIEA